MCVCVEAILLLVCSFLLLPDEVGRWKWEVTGFCNFRTGPSHARGVRTPAASLLLRDPRRCILEVYRLLRCIHLYLQSLDALWQTGHLLQDSDALASCVAIEFNNKSRMWL
jgi:hypothetical protein